ncbi:MAG: hypothetical protein ABJZ55_22970 [Fuerstiella sp.]
MTAAASISNGFDAFAIENGPIAGIARVDVYPEEIELEEFESARNKRTTRKTGFTKIQIPARYSIQLTLSLQTFSLIQSTT